jgi:hypothetical protein
MSQRACAEMCMSMSMAHVILLFCYIFLCENRKLLLSKANETKLLKVKKCFDNRMPGSISVIQSEDIWDQFEISCGCSLYLRIRTLKC